jgi:hypothetical protein
LVSDREELVAPAKGLLPKNHWYAGGGIPDATTLRLAVVLRMFVTLCGWPEMDGGTQTVIVATSLVTAPAELLTTTP